MYIELFVLISAKRQKLPKKSDQKYIKPDKNKK